MPAEPLNREIPPSRPPGRPPASVPKQPEKDALPDATQRHVPAQSCPKCGRGMTPKVERWELNGEASCICTLSGCRFNYRPASVRVKC